MTNMMKIGALFKEFWTFWHRDISAPFIQIVVNCHFYGIKHILIQIPNCRGAENRAPFSRCALEVSVTVLLV
jgi:hypothetical protein